MFWTILITALVTIYLTCAVCMGSGLYISRKKGFHNSPLTLTGEILFILFWPIAMPLWHFCK